MYVADRWRHRLHRLHVGRWHWATSNQSTLIAFAPAVFPVNFQFCLRRRQAACRTLCAVFLVDVAQVTTSFQSPAYSTFLSSTTGQYHQRLPDSTAVSQTPYEYCKSNQSEYRVYDEPPAGRTNERDSRRCICAAASVSETVRAEANNSARLHSSDCQAGYSWRTDSRAVLRRRPMFIRRDGQQRSRGVPPHCQQYAELLNLNPPPVRNSIRLRVSDVIDKLRTAIVSKAPLRP